MSSINSMKINDEWQFKLQNELDSSYMQELKKFLYTEKNFGKTIFPAEENYFRALNLTPPNKVKIVILGQDPYHGDGQAHGLSFSVPKGIKIPPSLRNIYKEIESDLGAEPSEHGFLEDWATQGVLLLNSVLSVERGQAASHKGKGWETFTDAVIAVLNENAQPIAFMLWGSYAQKKASFVDETRHLVLKAPHPSPLSAHRGFLGCRHFSKANIFLKNNSLDEINWKI